MYYCNLEILVKDKHIGKSVLFATAFILQGLKKNLLKSKSSILDNIYN